jgi:hypothetical protein
LLGGGTAVPGIKNFLYLDEYKIYSISSQIFEGITKSWVNTGRLTNEVVIDPIAVYREF